MQEEARLRKRRERERSQGLVNSFPLATDTRLVFISPCHHNKIEYDVTIIIYHIPHDELAAREVIPILFFHIFWSS